MTRTVEVIVVGGSAGAIDALAAILPALPHGFAVPIVLVLHVLPTKPSLLVSVFGARCALPVKEAEDKEPLAPSTIYVAPPNYHLFIEKGRYFGLSCDAPVKYSRPSIDVLFESAVDAYRSKLAGVLLSGANDDGVCGLAAINSHGGITVVQAPETAVVPVMPLAAMRSAKPTYVLRVSEIAPFLVRLVGPPAPTSPVSEL